MELFSLYLDIKIIEQSNDSPELKKIKIDAVRVQIKAVNLKLNYLLNRGESDDSKCFDAIVLAALFLAMIFISLKLLNGIISLVGQVYKLVR